MVNNKNIIGFAGRKRSGKGVLANLLKDEFNAKILTVADYLKYLCCDLLNVGYDNLNLMKDDGTTFSKYPDSRWYKIINIKTGISVNNIQSTIGGLEITSVRQMLQIIGTDLIRRYVPDWHVMRLMEDIDSYPSDKLIAIDDVRFPNEAQAIRNAGGKVFYIIRPDNIDISNHISETSLRWQDFDVENVLINNVGLEEYKSQFKMKFVNNFDINLKNGIFLSDNIEYIDEYQKFIETSYDNNNPLIKESLKIFK